MEYDKYICLAGGGEYKMEFFFSNVALTNMDFSSTFYIQRAAAYWRDGTNSRT